MRVLFYDDDIALAVDAPRSIFLAGPTLRSTETLDDARTPWRVEALALLQERGFPGVVAVPEFRDGRFADRVAARFGQPPSPDAAMSAETYNILDWETRGLDGCAAALFWMPFDDALPGLTTRAEVSRALTYSHRVAAGVPPGTRSASHILFHARRSEVPVHDTLDATVDAAIAICRPVFCAVCSSEHRDTLVGSPRNERKQGLDCAASEQERDGKRFVLCHYGSSLDGRLYECSVYLPNAWRGANPICDACIEREVEREHLRQLPGSFPLGIDHGDVSPPPFKEGVSVRHAAHREVFAWGESVKSKCGTFSISRGDLLATEGEAVTCEACRAV